MAEQRVHYFLGSRLLGSSPSLPMWDDATPSHFSTAYLCPTCGEVWARIAVEGGQEWHPIKAFCPKHSDYFGRPGGSFIHPWRKTYWELPQEVLKYELQLLLDRLEKGENNE